jgi:lactoylglutathione lyase
MDVEEKYPGYTHIALAISDINTVQSELEMAGIALSGGPMTFPDGSNSPFIRDPDRNVIEFHQAPV